MAASWRTIGFIIYNVGLTLSLPDPSAAAQTIKKPPKSAHPLPRKQVVAAAPEAIVVTARNRSEVERDVPISITSLTGRQLAAQGITHTTDLFGTVPSLYFSQGNFAPTTDFSYLTIRGIGAAPALDPSVGVFVDGVYQPQLGFDVGFLDVQRVEVLRGPQSTLFGRNTEAGALSIVTRKPGDDFYGSVTTGYDSFGGNKATGSVSGPITQNLFANFGATIVHDGGYIHNVTLDKTQNASNDYTLRSTVRWLPAEPIEVLVSGDYTYKGVGELGFGVPDGSKSYDVFDNRASTSKDKIGGASVTVNDDLRFATLTSQTAYRVADTRTFFDADGTASNVAIFNPSFPDFTEPEDGFDSRHTMQDDYSEQIRLTSTYPSRLKWFIGVFGFREDDDIDRLGRYTSGLAAPGGPDSVFDGSQPGAAGVVVNQKKLGYSLFADVTYDITRRLQLDLGYRYASETASAHSSVSFLVPLSQIPAGITYFPFELNLLGRRGFDRPLPSASLRYKVTDNLSAYLTYSTGTKSGGFQKFPANALDANGFGAEDSENYEAGIKYTNHWLDVSSSIYRVALINQQVSTTTLVQTGNGQTTPVGGVTNAAGARVEGVEFELGARAPGGWSLHLSTSYNDTKYTNYVDAQGLQRNGSPYQNFPYVPAWTGSVLFNKTTSLTDLLILNSQLSWHIIGHYYVGDGGAFTPFEQIASYDVLNLRMALSYKAWTGTFFINNLLDTYAITQRLAPSSDPFTLRDTPIPPRLVGGELTYRF